MALSVKTKEHIRRWAARVLPKWGALAGGGAALAAAIAFTGTALHFTTVNDTHGGSVRITESGKDGTVIELTLPISAEEQGIPCG